jgi:membrane protease YdiL (CAAX protease family)
VPLMMLVARPALALAAQSITALALRGNLSRRAWTSAAQYWMVYTSLVDLGCLAILVSQARREHIPLLTTMGFDERPPRPFRSALADVGLVVPAAVVSQLLSRPLGDGDRYPPQIRVAHLQGWARAYSLAAWPLVWGITEEATYLGYALPRLERRLGPVAAATLVAAAWALQHAVMPVLPGRRYALMRVITMLPVSTTFTAVYATRGRRLTPMVAAHWLSDASAALLAATLPTKPERDAP